MFLSMILEEGISSVDTALSFAEMQQMHPYLSGGKLGMHPENAFCM